MKSRTPHLPLLCVRMSSALSTQYFLMPRRARRNLTAIIVSRELVRLLGKTCLTNKTRIGDSIGAGYRKSNRD